MPKVLIKEIDNTSAGVEVFDDYVVFVPVAELVSSLKEVLVTKLEDFNDTSKFTEGTSTNLKAAKEFVKLGLNVLCAAAPSFTTVSTEADRWAYWGRYADKALFNIRFFYLGQYGMAGKQNAEQALAATGFVNTKDAIACAAIRGDAVALVDYPEFYTDVALSEEFYTVSQTEEWLQTNLLVDLELTGGVLGCNIADNILTGPKNRKENVLVYAACFGSTFTGAVISSSDETVWPATFGYVAAFAKHTERFPAWFAMAGSVRGVLPYTKIKTTVDFGSADIDILQDRTTIGNIGINPIAEVRPYGKIIWGNRTMFPNKAVEGSETVAGLVASSFLNIRNLCCDIKKTLYRAARRYTFEPNTDTLWINFVSAIKPLLEDMKTGQGIRGYKLIKHKSAEKATLTATIRIIPIEAVEDFDLTVELSDSVEVNE